GGRSLELNTVANRKLSNGHSYRSRHSATRLEPRAFDGLPGPADSDVDRRHRQFLILRLSDRGGNSDCWKRALRVVGLGLFCGFDERLLSDQTEAPRPVRFRGNVRDFDVPGCGALSFRLSRDQPLELLSQFGAGSVAHLAL